jgi:DNA-binding CsgD family transcriptional regulator
VPSTLTVSAELLGRGLRGTLQPAYEGALGDLVRAAETYSAAGSAEAVPELPAVIAALAALHTGELEVAAGVLDTALRHRHGGGWARPRLQLWRAWIDLQWQRPNDVEAALHEVETAGAISPRDRLLAEAIRVGLARRYSDASGLAAAWRAAQETILRTQFDLFSILPLAEFAVAAARVGDSARMHGHVARAAADMARLGSPPLWAPHLHWAGIQEGILLNSPDSLRPHARELVAAAPHNPVAAAMARAGRVWTAVLGGDVDADAVEDAALGLADVGLAWDGARLAGHGAGRTDDRRINARLLACARQLHPHEGLRDDEGSDAESAARPAPTLSAREREVALLVVQGMTYAEIGETIFISPRTAEHHIARIRRRLGATSRSDLIAKLRIAIDGAATSEPRRRAGRDTM